MRNQAKNDAASAQADVAEAEANHAAAVAGPTKEERFIADAQVKAAAAALAVLERQLDKTILRAPADGIVSVIVAEISENIRAGEPVLVIEDTGKQWLSFNVREDQLHGLTVGTSVDVARAGTADLTPSVVTELVPLAPSRHGRPSERSPTMIATRCACVSVRKATRPDLSRA